MSKIKVKVKITKATPVKPAKPLRPSERRRAV